MLRGISLKLSYEKSQIKELFSSFPTEKFWWQIHYSDAFVNLDGAVKKDSEKMFENGTIINGFDLKQIIQTPSSYIVFLAMAASDEKIDDLVLLNSYQDFLSSNLMLLVNIYDVYYVQIYCKNESIIEAIRKSAFAMGCASVEYITEENDPEYFEEFSYKHIVRD